MGTKQDDNLQILCSVLEWGTWSTWFTSASPSSHTRVERPKHQRGMHRIASAVDYEATFRMHEGQSAVLGTNAVLQQQIAAAQPVPPTLVMGRLLNPKRVCRTGRIVGQPDIC